MNVLKWPIWKLGKNWKLAIIYANIKSWNLVIKDGYEYNFGLFFRKTVILNLLCNYYNFSWQILKRTLKWYLKLFKCALHNKDQCLNEFWKRCVCSSKTFALMHNQQNKQSIANRHSRSNTIICRLQCSIRLMGATKNNRLGLFYLWFFTLCPLRHRFWWLIPKSLVFQP